jgi:hypothetical protein
MARKNVPSVNFAFLILLIAAIAAAQQPAANPASPAQAPAVQNGKIEGTVVKSGGGPPVKTATVSLQRTDSTTRGNGANGTNPLAALNLGAAGQNGLGALLGGLTGTTLSGATDSKGQFSIANVPPGQYRISVDGDGFVKQEYGQKTFSGRGTTVAVAPGQTLTVDFQLTPASTISGRVHGDDGEAVFGATVQAYSYRYSNGTRTMAQVATAQTNDLGEFRLFWLQPGEYFVGVVARGGNAGRGNAQIATLLGNNNAALQPLIQQFTQAGGAPPVFFPGVLDSDQATPLKVSAASDVRGVDFNLRPVTTVSLRGRVITPFSPAPAAQANRDAARGGLRGGNQNGGGLDIQALLGGQGVQVNLTRAGSAQNGIAALGLGGLVGGGTPVAADGTFEIRNVASGTYSLTASARDANGQQYTARTKVEVGGSDVNNLALSVRPGVEVRGQIILDSTQKTVDLTRLRVNLVAADDPTGGAISQLTTALAAAPAARGRGAAAGAGNAAGGAANGATGAAAGGGNAARGGGNGGNAAAAGGARGTAGAQGQVLTGLLAGQLQGGAVAADGTFTLTNVNAFEYRVRVSGLPAGFYLKSGQIGTLDALSVPFTVNGQSDTLQLRIGTSTGRVSGTVLDSKGMPVAGVMAALIPDPSRRGRTDMYFSANTGQDGHFSFTNVPPGSYKVFSWEEIPAGAYQYPDFIRSFEDRGQSITVEPDGSLEKEVRVIPAG